MQVKHSYHSHADKVSIAASLICAVHCIALPIFFSTVPFLGIEILHNPFIEAATILVSMSIGGWAIWRGYQLYHKSKFILLLFIAGLICMVAGNFVPDRVIEMSLKFIGGIMVVTAHIQNWRKGLHCATHIHNDAKEPARRVDELVS